MGQLGLDAVIEEPFSRKFSTVEPQEFFTEVVLRAVGAESIVVGYDFAFGKGRTGHLTALEAFCKGAGVELEVVTPQRVDHEIASSSKIRQHLMAGDIPAASHLLGRDFFYRGVVIKGDGRGRTIGFPTANLKIDDKLALPYGVYATRAVITGPGGSTVHNSVTNVGVRPTFKPGPGELHALVETHLLDFSRDLYGTTLEVRFVAKLRDERKFAGVDELKAQIARDVIQARGLLGALI
jgi:riboflavin kinase/FMN adenylyltransferase